MKSAPLWQISVTTSPEAEEAVAALLEHHTGQTPSIYSNEETRLSTASVYCDSPPNPALAPGLRSGLAALETSGLAVAPGRVEVAPLKREDWAESWKKHFKPIRIGRHLLILPSWIRRQARPGQAVVVLDPGLSFGTGHHATTSFCLQQLVKARLPHRRQSLLDIGTGSGILAIAAAKLGYRPVTGFDFDPEAVRVARTNARANRVSPTLRRQDLTRLPRRSRSRHEVICANLIFDLLIQERDRILHRLAPGGRLLLAGILTTQFDRVTAAYAEAGMRLVARRVEKEWCSGAFRHR